MQSKKETIESFLQKGKTIIYVDSRKENVMLPDYLMGLIQVKLSLSYKYPHNVFLLTDEFLKIDLSFNQNKFVCDIPLDAIYLVASSDDVSDLVTFFESVPEIFIQIAEDIQTLKESTNEIDFEGFFKSHD